MARTMLSRLGLLLVAAGVPALSAAPPLLRAGFGHVPPLSYRDADGHPAGFSVEVLNEAARREGIRLEWRPAGTSLQIEQALASGALDIIPAGLVTGTRRKRFYLSEPWWFSELSVLVRAGTNLRSAPDLRGKRLALASPIYHELVRRLLPPLTEVPEQQSVDAGIAVCTGDADAALMTRGDVQEIAMQRPEPCRDTRFASLETEANMELALMSPRSREHIVRRLRARIDEMAIDGTLAAIASRYPPIPTSGAVHLAEGLRQRYERRVWLIALVAAMILLGASAWLIWVLRRDIAARQRAQAELERSEERLSLAHGIASLGNWEIDPRTGAANWSESASRIAQIPADARDWQAFLERVDPEDAERVRAAFAQTVQKGEPLKTSYWLIGPDGARSYVRQFAEAVRDPSGRVTAIMGTVQDLSDYKRLEEQFWQSHKLETVGQLAGGIAHDFNNLLTVINGYADLSMALLPEADPIRAHIEEIRSAGERAAALTMQLLTFSRRQPMRLAPVDLNGVVRDAGKLLNRLVGERIQVITALEPVAPIKADAVHIQQLLMNLVVNARDAMPGGGRIVIATGHASVPEGGGAEHGNPAPGPYVELSVTDTGTGMDEKIRSRIFEPFFTTKPKGAGTGLGLSVVYGIVKQSDGWISVESEPGKGSRFRVFFPSTQEPEPRAEAGGQAPEPLRGKETILVVEDQDTVRHLTVMILRRYGYSVLEAANGTEALRILRDPAITVDLLVTDIIMPGMSGRELVHLIQLERPDLPVLFTSGYSDSVQELEQSGVPFLAKPFTPEALGRAVREVLGDAADGDRERAAGG